MTDDPEHVRKRAAYVLDASAVVDYYNARSMKILKLFGKRVGRLYVWDHTPEMDASRLPRDACEKAGIRLHEPSPGQFVEAEQWERPRSLSRPDRLNIIIARDMPAILVTNDRLQRECAADHGVSVIWGLSMVLALVKSRELAADAAIAVLEGIQNHNPKYVNDEIVKVFIERIDSISSRISRVSTTRRRKKPSPRAKC